MDRNLYAVIVCSTVDRRSLRGSVDRNSAVRSQSSPPEVAPFAGAWIETRSPSQSSPPGDVAPFAGAWIETISPSTLAPFSMVAPFAGAWIETSMRSLSARRLIVAPFAGAWIETRSPSQSSPPGDVAPFAGAWIETISPSTLAPFSMVAPFAGAWIETASTAPSEAPPPSRSLRGSVDRNFQRPFLSNIIGASLPDGGFRRWLAESMRYTPRVAGNVVSRYRRVVRLLGEGVWRARPVDAIHQLEDLPEFREMSPSVRSQLKRAITLRAEYKKSA